MITGAQPLFEGMKRACGEALLGFRAKGRKAVEGREGYRVREGPGLYDGLFRAENCDIGAQNTYFRDIYLE